jgi:C-terminal processing protease CtpA/Prc
MRKMLGRFILTGALFAGQIATSNAASDVPPFQEVYDLIRTNAGGVNASELNEAAVEGLLARLSSEAWRIVPSRSSSTETNIAAVSSTALFDQSYGYIRVGNVGPRLPEEFRAAMEKLSSTNQLKGLVLDLRYAAGTDYDAATKVADRFLGSEQPLLDWGKGVVRSTDKTNAFRAPVAVLVNQHTAGAAEALAAMVRQADIGLLIGTNTAGQASMTRDFKLSNGDILRVAVSPVKVAGSEVVERLKPDIRVDVSPEDEKAYFVDAYKVLARPGTGAMTNLASLTVTNKPRRRMNEAELVRMLREGEVPDEEQARAAAPVEPARPVITDPALSRAIDLLKALAVVRHTRS